MGSSEKDVKIEVDANNLYREETYTDLKVASFRQLLPVKVDGSPDTSREPIIMGMTHVTSQAGPVPVQCHCEAKTLEDAIKEFPEAAKRSLEKMVAEARELQQQRAAQEQSRAKPTGSKLVLP